jgi:uncharacterized protein (TIGR03382 family)
LEWGYEEVGKTVAQLVLICAAWAPAASRADGAFPGSFSILAPVDQPNRLILATNFGLIASEDNGGTWYLVCEQAENSPNASIYALGPPPLDELGAVSLLGLSISTDDACTWNPSGGGLANTFVEDVFFDPTNASTVLAIATAPSDAGGAQPYGLYSSTNGGASFGTNLLFQGDAELGLVSVEVARSSPNTIYLALFQHTDVAGPLLNRSDDFGQTWQSFDLIPAVGQKTVRIAAVDPEDASRVYLRVIDPFQGLDQLAIVTDGGASVAIPLSLPTPMSGFLRRASGELIVTCDGGSVHSVDNGETFLPWETGLHLQGVTERAGTLYLVGNNFSDGFAVAQSTDDGATLETLLQYSRICGLKSCGTVVSSCEAFYSSLATELNISPDACSGAPPPKGCGCVASDAAGAATVASLSLLLALSRRQRRAKS